MKKLIATSTLYRYNLGALPYDVIRRQTANPFQRIRILFLGALSQLVFPRLSQWYWTWFIYLNALEKAGDMHFSFLSDECSNVSATSFL